MPVAGVVLAFVACLAGQPRETAAEQALNCEAVVPAYAHDDGSPLTLFGCLGVDGQLAKARWDAEHPGEPVWKVVCGAASDVGMLRERLRDRRA